MCVALAVAVEVLEAAAVDPPQEESTMAAAGAASKTGVSPAATMRQAHIDTMLTKAKHGGSKAMGSKTGAASKAKLAKPTGWACPHLNTITCQQLVTVGAATTS